MALVGGIQAEPRPLKIGVLLGLSGELAPLGQEIQKGLNLAADHINQTAKLELVFEDIGSLNPKQAASAAQKLLNVDHVQAVVCMIIEEAEPVIPNL
jgi:ABC-type branched-subunit amino acid transport system substrate-binding protein